MREYVTQCVDLGYCPGGIMRQVMAAVSIGDLRPDLKTLKLPATGQSGILCGGTQLWRP